MVSPVGEVAGAAATAEPAPVAAVITATPAASPTLPATGAGTVPSPAPTSAPSAQPTLPPAGPGVPPAAVTALDRPDGYRAAIAAPLPPAALTGYRWPLAHGRITLPFGPTAWGTRVVDGKLFHDGIDLATFCGDRVVAAHAGKVIAVGRHFDDAIGWVGDLQPYYKRLDAKHLWYELPIVVIVADGNGYRSIYAHFSDVAVKRGQTIKAGQFLGPRGPDGPGDRLPRPLRAVQPARDRDVRGRARGGQADEGAALPGRAHRPAAGAAVAEGAAGLLGVARDRRADLALISARRAGGSGGR